MFVYTIQPSDNRLYRVNGSSDAPLTNRRARTRTSSVHERIVHNQCLTVNYLRQGGYVIVVVCLFVSLTVSNFAQKLLNGFAWNVHRRLIMGQWTNDYILLEIEITVWIQGLFCVFVTIGRYGDTDSPDGGTRRTYLGWGMHWSNTSSSVLVFLGATVCKTVCPMLSDRNQGKERSKRQR